MLSLLLPYRRTTEGKAREAMQRCGVSPDKVAWKVGPDGSFAFGKKQPDGQDLRQEQVACLIDWTRRERIKLGFLAWEPSRD